MQNDSSASKTMKRKTTSKAAPDANTTLAATPNAAASKLQPTTKNEAMSMHRNAEHQDRQNKRKGQGADRHRSSCRQRVQDH